MRILVANDDGIRSEGIAVLERVARTMSDDVWVVAPEEEQSGAGHSLSLHTPIRMRKVDERHFAVRGTPTDAVLMAVLEIIGDNKPDLLLSGINHGVNLAEDVTYSGTIAAAMEGTLLDIPSIALSTRITPGAPIEWDAAEHYAKQLVPQLVEAGWPKGNLINVNFPGLPKGQVKGVKICPQGRRKIGEKLVRREDPKGHPYFWIGGPGTEPYDDYPAADYMQCFDGYVTVTPLNLDLTDYRALETLREHVAP